MLLPFSRFFKMKGETSSPQHYWALSGFFLMPHVLKEICIIILSCDIFKALPDIFYLSKNYS